MELWSCVYGVMELSVWSYGAVCMELWSGMYVITGIPLW